MQEDSCHHPNGTFIGVQHNPFTDKYFALFNCSECGSTYAIHLSSEEEVAKLSFIDVKMNRLNLKAVQ